MSNFSYAACTYLNEYLRADKPCIDALESGASPQVICEALSKVATIYNINRTLWLNKEELRLDGARDLLMQVRRPKGDQSVANAVDQLAQELGATYPRYNKKGPKDVQYAPELLSAASKFLWMRFQKPIVMYDRYAWQWIKRAHRLPHSRSYTDYVGAWRVSFRDSEKAISEACSGLVPFRSYTLAAAMSEKELDELVRQDWFRERVFDHAIIDAEQKREAEKQARKEARESAG
jgi:hypothetical protein